jgi:hypothetical protein
MVSLHDVFGIAEHVKPHSYVDRGGLDSQLTYALGAERHIAVHGASKQGKSWLRSRVLSDDASVLVQCQTGTTVESLFTDALGALGVRAELRRTAGSDFEGRLDFSGSGSLGTHLLGKLGLEMSAGGKRLRSTRTETQPVGQTPANLWWVAHTILASERRLVIEDCHYLADPSLRDLAFVLKAVSGYGLHVLVAGIWARDHLLTYYNGDLVGRVEDIHLAWSDEELDAVLRAGCRALNIEMSTNLRRHSSRTRPATSDCCSTSPRQSAAKRASSPVSEARSTSPPGRPSIVHAMPWPTACASASRRSPRISMTRPARYDRGCVNPSWSCARFSNVTTVNFRWEPPTLPLPRKWRRWDTPCTRLLCVSS